MRKLLWFTDLHLRGVADAEGQFAADRFRRVLDHATLHHRDAERILVTGDIADEGEAEAYHAFAAMTNGLELPVSCVPGNHDNPNMMQKSIAGARAGWPLDIAWGDYRMLLIDTSQRNETAGAIKDADLVWLDRCLSEAEAPVFIILHHQPAGLFMPSVDMIGLRNADAFGSFVSRHRTRIARLFFGHCHLPIGGSLHGVPISGLPATARQQYPNFADRRFIADPAADPVYGVVIAEGPILAVHTVPVRHCNLI